jgi:hypothetical protein
MCSFVTTTENNIIEVQHTSMTNDYCCYSFYDYCGGGDCRSYCCPNTSSYGAVVTLDYFASAFAPPSPTPSIENSLFFLVGSIHEPRRVYEITFILR